MSSILINAYCTHRNPPPLDFRHQFNNRRDRSDPNLVPHLRQFIGFVLDDGQREMTQTLYHVMRHIERVQQQFSFEIDERVFRSFSKWARSANAIVYLPDGTVRDPSGAVLVDPETGLADEGADVPYPKDALIRRKANHAKLQPLGIEVPATLPPVVSDAEVHLRSPEAVALRCLSLLVVSIKGSTAAAGEDIPLETLKELYPLGFRDLTPSEKAFLLAPHPDEPTNIAFSWRYEALLILLWSLGHVSKLELPTTMCEGTVGDDLDGEQNQIKFVNSARLRPLDKILDAYDIHYRLHWATTDARINEREMPAGLMDGVVAERHYAFNWLVRFEDAAWDNVTTPT